MIQEIIKFGIVMLIVFLVYKSGIHKKVYKVLNQWIGDTRVQQVDARKRKRFMYKLLKRMKHEDEL